MVYPDGRSSEPYARGHFDHSRIAKVLPGVEQGFFYREFYPYPVLLFRAYLFKEPVQLLRYAFYGHSRKNEVLFYRQLSYRFAEIYREHQNDGYRVGYVGQGDTVIEYLSDSSEYRQQPESHESCEPAPAERLPRSYGTYDQKDDPGKRDQRQQYEAAASMVSVLLIEIIKESEYP